MGQFFQNDPALDEAFVATALHRMGNVIDLISGEHVILGAFARAGGVVGLEAGHTIAQPLLIAESGTPTWFKGMDTVAKDFTPGLTEAEYSYSWVSHPTRMEYTTRWENSGPGRVMSVEEQRFRQTRKTLMNDLAAKKVSGTGGRQPVGILTAVEAAAVGAQTEVVGGIDKSVHQWWNNQFRQLATTVNFGDDVGGISAGVLMYMQLFLDCTVGTSRPRWLFVTEAQGENFLRSMVAQYGIRSTGRVDESVEITPHNVQLFGRPVIPTDEMPADSGVWLTLNREGEGGGKFQNRESVSELGEVTARELGGMYCAYHPQVNMTLDGPRVAGAQHVDYTFFLHSMAVIYENLAQQGRGGSVDAGGLDNWS